MVVFSGSFHRKAIVKFRILYICTLTGNIPHVAFVETKSFKVLLDGSVGLCVFISSGNCDIGDFVEINVFREYSMNVFVT